MIMMIYLSTNSPYLPPTLQLGCCGRFLGLICLFVSFYVEGEDSPERGHDDQSEGVPELSEVKLCRSCRKKCAHCAPGHAAVDGEVEGVGEVDAEVDGGRDVFCQLVIKKFHHTVLQKRESLIKLKCTGSIRKVVISFRC